MSTVVLVVTQAQVLNSLEQLVLIVSAVVNVLEVEGTVNVATVVGATSLELLRPAKPAPEPPCPVPDAAVPVPLAGDDPVMVLPVGIDIIGTVGVKPGVKVTNTVVVTVGSPSVGPGVVPVGVEVGLLLVVSETSPSSIPSSTFAQSVMSEGIVKKQPQYAYACNV